MDLIKKYKVKHLTKSQEKKAQKVLDLISELKKMVYKLALHRPLKIR